jgi:hypothetical protein
MMTFAVIYKEKDKGWQISHITSGDDGRILAFCGANDIREQEASYNKKTKVEVVDYDEFHMGKYKPLKWTTSTNDIIRMIDKFTT